MGLLHFQNLLCHAQHTLQELSTAWPLLQKSSTAVGAMDEMEEEETGGVGVFLGREEERTGHSKANDLSHCSIEFCLRRGDSIRRSSFIRQRNQRGNAFALPSSCGCGC